MKTILRVLVVLVTIVLILISLSCSSQTSEQETILQDGETSTITEDESSEHPYQTTTGIPLITIDELLQLTESNADIVIVDVRSEENYLLSHIEGAISVPEYVIQAGEWDPPDGKVLVLY
jgi:hypothetical protein